MAEFSDYLEDAILNHTLRNTALTSPTALYLALHSADPTDDGSGAELAIANGYGRIITVWNAPSAGVCTLATEIVFTASGADWTQATHIGLWDASTAGNLYYRGALDTARTVLDGGTLTFVVTTGLTITLQ